MQNKVKTEEEIASEMSFEVLHMSPDIDIAKHDAAIVQNRDWRMLIITKQLWRNSHENL